ncbi:MAG: FKBP-type peptidyl-prolyl cis-trans isomerase [Acidobacteriota bacterium]
MTLRWLLVLMIGLLARVSASQDTPASPDAAGFTDAKEKFSYALGVSLAKELRSQSIDVDPDVLSRGFKDFLSNSRLRLTEREVADLIAGMPKDVRGNRGPLPDQIRVRKELAEKNQKEGDAFLSENKAKEGVVTLASGLQYKVQKMGQGRKPTIDDSVVCQYRGTLIDGTEFDSSHNRKPAATFALKRVIKGWSDALQLMPVGSRWQLFVPPGLAYGVRGAGTAIGPGATLIFDVELISIAEKNANRAAGGADPGGPAGGVGAAEPVGAGPSAGAAAPRLMVAFKLDSRLATGTYGGERWVSPSTYTQVGEGRTCSIEARGEFLDSSGARGAIGCKWTAADPEMVTTTPRQGNQVTLTVQRAGESRVRVTAEGVSRELTVTAVYRNNVLQADISQK